MDNPIKDFLNSIGLLNYSVVRLETLHKLYRPAAICKLSRKYPMWRVSDCSFDKEVMEHWKNGNLVLVNALTVDRVLIPTDMFKSMFTPDLQMEFYDWLKEADKIEEDLLKVSHKIQETGELKPGFMFFLGVADGAATYIVTKVNKKSVHIELLKFGDGYADRWLKGGGKLSMQDFIEHSGWGRKPLFGSKIA